MPKKIASFLAVVSFAAVISLSAMFPVENLFVNFESPERVFHYTNFGEIDEIIYGHDSCLVVYAKENSTCSHYIIPRTAKGYKIPNFFPLQEKENENELLNEMGEKVESNIVRVENTSFIYFFLPDFSGEYCLSINGEKIFISG